MLLEKIEIIEKRYDEIYQMISNPDIIADQKKYIQLNKELKELSKLVETGIMYKNAVSQKLEAEEYLNSSDDDDMIAMAKEELDLSKQDIKNVEAEI
jgi:peptide chain release factor 1